MQVGIRSAEPAKPEDGELRSETRHKPQVADPAFDAALLRAQPRARHGDDDLNEEPKAEPSAERAPWPLGLQVVNPGHAEHTSPRATAGNAQLDKQNGQHALSQLQQVQTVLPSHAVPPTVATVTNLRADLAMPQNMTMHLQQAAPGQWNMRFKTDAHTQQLVAPHLHALRDRLKGRQVRVDGFAADDDELS